MCKIELGDTIKHKVTGFQGVVTCIATYLRTPTRLSVEAQGLDTNSRPIPDQWYELSEVDKVE